MRADAKPINRFRAWAFPITLSLLSVIVLGFGAEALVRVLVPDLSSQYGYHPEFPYEFAEDVGWRHRPSRTFQWRQREFDVTFETNRLGYRSSRPFEPGTPERVVVALLGDSFVQALQVEESESIGARLEAALSERRPTQVQNFGVSNHGLIHELQVFRHDAAPLKPSVVVAFVNTNDFRDSFPGFTTRGFPAPRLELDQGRIVDVAPFELNERSGSPEMVPLAHPGRLARWRFRLFTRSALYRYVTRATLRSELMQLAFPLEAFIYQRPPSPPWQDVWGVGQWCLTRLLNEVRAAGAQPVVVLVPRNWDVSDDVWAALVSAHRASGSSGELDRARLRTGLADLCQGMSVPFVDLVGPFRDASVEGRSLFYRHDLHWNAEGHRLAARILAERLGELGYLAPSP